MKKTFPCPYCTRLGESSEEQGDMIDVGDSSTGSLMLQVSANTFCSGCDGDGFIEVGSEKHFSIKCNSAVSMIVKIFDNALDYLPDKEHDAFWDGLSSFEVLKKTWLEHNQQKG